MNQSLDITNVLLFLLAQPAGGAVVVAISQFLKKTIHMDNKHAIHAVVVAVSVITALAAYYLKFRGLPLKVIGISVPATYGFSQGLYNFCKLLSVVLPKVSAVLGALTNAMSRKAATPANLANLDLQVPDDLIAEPSAVTQATTEPQEFDA